MSWKTVKIGDFLTERKDRFKPDEANASGLSRIQKIDFSGKIHVKDGKETKTGMILVKTNDLVISGINVTKGALGIYRGKKDVLATIHYSSYQYDMKEINIDYLKWYLKSPVFKSILQTQTRGGIKTEIKPKTFLKLEISLPDVLTQNSVVEKITATENQIVGVDNLNSENQSLVSKLRQSILQDAIQGKLVPQDTNDEPASVLLEKIKAEKEQLVKEKKIRKPKPLPEIAEDEKPFDLPKGWEWCRLDALLQVREYGSSEKASMDDTQIPMLRMGNIQNSKLVFDNLKYLSRTSKDLPRLFLKKGDLLFNRTNSWELVGKTALFEEGDDKYTFAGYLIRLRFMDNHLNSYYANYYMNSEFFRKIQIEPEIAQQCGQANYNGTKLSNTLFPLPPLAEQHRIVAKVDELMKLCDALEAQVNEAKESGEKLMESVLAEVF